MGRQSVLVVLVAGGVAFAVGMAFQTAGGIVMEAFFAAVGVNGDGEILVKVVMVFGGAAAWVGDFTQQPVLLVFKTGGVLHRIGMQHQVTGFVVAVAVGIAFGIGFTDETVAVVVIKMQDGAVGADDGFYLAFVAVLVAGYPAHGIGMAEHTAKMVSFHQISAAVGKYLFG